MCIGPHGWRTCMRGIKRARIALLAVMPAALFAAVPGTASAGVLVASAPNCDNGPNSQPFAQWNDDNNYFLAPGGNFEANLGDWSRGSADTVADQEPWGVAEDGGNNALRIPAGRSVVSP